MITLDPPTLVVVIFRGHDFRHNSEEWCVHGVRAALWAAGVWRLGKSRGGQALRGLDRGSSDALRGSPMRNEVVA